MARIPDCAALHPGYEAASLVRRPGRHSTTPAANRSSTTHIESPVTLLLAALHDQDDRVVRAATARVATLPESELPAIWSAIRSAGPRVRADLVRAVEVFDPARLARLAGSNAQAPDPADRGAGTGGPALNLSPLQPPHRVVARPRGERHVRDRGILIPG